MKIKMIVLFMLLMTACTQRDSEIITEDLSKLLNDAVQAKQSSFVLTGFRVDWDSLLIAPPYSNAKKMSQSLKVDLGGVSETGIRERDDICVLVFIKRGRIISCVSFKRGVYDFAMLPSDKFFVRGDKFELVPDPSSRKPRYIIKVRV